MPWRRTMPPMTELVGRGHGLAVLRDTTGLVVDPAHGAAQVTLVDVATGEVRASWLPPHGIGTVLVVGSTAEPVILLSSATGTDAVSVDGDLLWSSGRGGWEPTIDAGETVVLQTGRMGGDAVALDVRTGAEVWSRPALSRPYFAFWGVPRLDRFFAWQLEGTSLAVVRVDLVTGGARVVARGDLPPAYAGAGLTVLEDLMDADCAGGHLTIRASVDEGGRRLGDLLVVAGDPLVHILTPVPVGIEDRSPDALLSPSCTPDHLVRGREVVTCTDLTGGTVWTRTGWAYVRQRVGDVVLVTTGAPAMSAQDRRVVEAVADDGGTRWRCDGALWIVAHGTVWVRDGRRLSVVDAATGRVLWTGVPGWLAAEEYVHQLHTAADADDRMVVVADGSGLQGLGPV